MMFHENPQNTESTMLGPRLTAETHLMDPLDSTLEFTCCYLAKQNGVLDTHDCDRYHVYYVRREVAKRYREYMKSGAIEVRNQNRAQLLPSPASRN